MVQIAGKGAASTSDATLSGGSSGRDFLDVNYTVTQDAALTDIDIYLRAGNIIKIKVWRYNGGTDTYEFISQTGTFTSPSTGIHNVVVTPNINVLAGDIIDIWLDNDTGNIDVAAAPVGAMDFDDGDFITDQPAANFTALDFAINYTANGTPLSSDTVNIEDIQNANQKDIPANNKSITFNGTYTGTPTALQRRLEYADNNEVISDWVTFDAAPSGGSFSSSDTINASDRPINIIVRFSNDTGVTGTSNNFYIGDFLLITGESIAEDMGTDGTGTPNTGVFMWDDSTGNITTPSAGAGQIELANTINAQTGHSVFIRNTGVGGTKMFQENGTPYLYDAVTNQAQYQAILDAHSAAGSYIPFLCLFIGANDAYYAVLPKVDVVANYALFFTKLRSDTQADLKVIATLTGRHMSTGIAGDQLWTDNVLAQKQAFDNDNSVYYTSFYDVDLKDDVHPTIAGYQELGRRAANTVITEIYGGSSPYKPPSISSVSAISTTQTLFTLSRPEGTDITPLLNITDVGLSEDGFTSEVLVSSVNRVDTTSFVATHTNATVTDYRYNWGANPDITGIVQDNSIRTLPLIQAEGSVLLVGSNLVMSNTNTPDGTYSFKIYNDDTNSYLETRNITFSGGSATETLGVVSGTNVFVLGKGINPPVTGMCYIGVTT